MLNPATIDKFLERKLDSFDWIKKYTRNELLAAIAELDPTPDFGDSKLWKHQLVCFLLAVELRRLMLFCDMGAGKTLISLMLIRYLKKCGFKPRVIVFVPYITSVSTWIDEVAKHAPDLYCVPLLGTGADNISALSGGGDLFVGCYQSIVSAVTETVQVKGKNKWKLDAGKTRKYFDGFNVLVMDEIHKCKNIHSLTYKMCRAISAQCEYVLGLTGTPFGKNLMDLWSQFYLIDFGETLGPTLTFYRSVFFNEKKGYFGGYEYTFKKRLFADLKEMVKNRSIRYELDEFADMPPLMGPFIQKVPMPTVGEGFIQKALTNINEAIIAKNYRAVESHYLQLRQLSSGFMTLKGDDTSKVEVEFEDNPKLDALEDLIASIPFGCKMVVFHHFVYTNEIISKRLKQMKVGHARVYGKQKDPIGELKRFKNDPECKVLVINDKSGSSSLNLQHANYLVFFEEPDSPIDWQQAKSRVYRSGQTRRVFMYHLHVDGTWDGRIYRSNKAGETLLKSLLSSRGSKDE